VSESPKYKKYFRRVVDRNSHSRFVMVETGITCYLKGDCNAAAVLAFILFRLSLVKDQPEEMKKLDDNDFWFLCPAGKIQEFFGMSDEKQATCIKNLVRAELIEVDRRKGNFLWVKINGLLIDKCNSKDETEVPEPVQPKTKPGNRESRELPETGFPGFRESRSLRHRESRDPSICIKKGIEENTLSQFPSRPTASRETASRACNGLRPQLKPSDSDTNGSSNGTHTSNGNGKHKNNHHPGGNGHAVKTTNRIKGLLNDSPLEEDGPRQVASKLNEIVIRHNYKSGNAKSHLWHKPIRKLYPLWTTEELLDLLNWYDDHFNEQFVPEIYCGDSLAKKIDKLIRCRERYRNKQQSQPYSKDDENEWEVQDRAVRAFCREKGLDYDEFMGEDAWHPPTQGREE